MKNYPKNFTAEIIYDTTDVPTLSNQNPYHHRYIHITALSLTEAWKQLHKIITPAEKQQAAIHGMPITNMYIKQI